MEKTNQNTENKTTITSYAKLLQALTSEDVASVEGFKNLLLSMDFVEDLDETYNGMPISVSYQVIPIVTGGDVYVKIILLNQVDNFALVLPEDVLEVYNILNEEPDRMAEMNVGFALYAEIYGFSKDDQELLELIKRVYLKANSFSPAFELATNLKVKNTDKDDQPDEDSEDSFDVGSLPMGEISDDDLDNLGDLKPNAEAYKLFKKNTTFLEQFLFETYTKSSKLLQNNIKYKYLNENKNVLLLEVDNNSVYQTLSNLSKAAKKVLSYFGESIKSSSKVQLVDSFTKNNKRYFVLVENAGNNFWIVKGEHLDLLIEDTHYIKPLQSNIIELTKSSIRQDSRKVRAYKENRDIIFTIGR